MSDEAIAEIEQRAADKARKEAENADKIRQSVTMKEILARFGISSPLNHNASSPVMVKIADMFAQGADVPPHDMLRLIQTVASDINQLEEESLRKDADTERKLTAANLEAKEQLKKALEGAHAHFDEVKFQLGVVAEQRVADATAIAKTVIVEEEAKNAEKLAEYERKLSIAAERITELEHEIKVNKQVEESARKWSVCEEHNTGTKKLLRCSWLLTPETLVVLTRLQERFKNYNRATEKLPADISKRSDRILRQASHRSTDFVARALHTKFFIYLDGIKPEGGGGAWHNGDSKEEGGEDAKEDEKEPKKPLQPITTKKVTDVDAIVRFATQLIESDDDTLFDILYDGGLARM